MYFSHAANKMFKQSTCENLLSEVLTQKTWLSIENNMKIAKRQVQNQFYLSIRFFKRNWECCKSHQRSCSGDKFNSLQLLIWSHRWQRLLEGVVFIKKSILSRFSKIFDEISLNPDLKEEHRHTTQSFKLRGAANSILLNPDIDVFVTASTGNHALAFRKVSFSKVFEFFKNLVWKGLVWSFFSFKTVSVNP